MFWFGNTLTSVSLFDFFHYLLYRHCDSSEKVSFCVVVLSTQWELRVVK